MKIKASIEYVLIGLLPLFYIGDLYNPYTEFMFKFDEKLLACSSL